MNPLRGTSSSGSECEQSTDDIWDDTLIIRNYDESLALVKEEVAKRLAMKTNKKMLAKVKAEQASLEQVTPNEEGEVKREEAESSGVEGSSAEKGTYESADKTLKVGDYCRATYDDGVDYEAKVLAVDKKNNALIRYVGYNNEQTVSLEDLIPSWGRKARRKQREEAAELAAAEDSNRMEISDDEEKLTKKASKIRINFDPNFHMPKPRASSSVTAGFGAGMGASFMVPPPPPMPPMFADDDDLDSEHLSAMLMSWYMSGYYTGLYHGQKMSQKRSRPS